MILSLLIFLYPPLYGEGYDTIINLLTNKESQLQGSPFALLGSSYWGIMLFLLLVILFKPFATSATNAGGGVGGIFAPSLFLGAVAGYLFSHGLNYFDIGPLPEENYALLGMAGVMAGVMHAPLTGVFLIAELTGGYALFLPLLIVATSSYLTIKTFEKHNIYTKRLAKKGELLTHHKDKAVLTLMSIDSVIERDFIALKPDMLLADVVDAISHSKRNMFPVISDDGVLQGVVLIDDIRNIMFRQELYNRFRVSRFMISSGNKLLNTMSMEQAMKSFDESKAWNLPVIDDQGRYLGFISKSKIFNAYREILVERYSED